jgi:hypothetical protein
MELQGRGTAAESAEPAPAAGFFDEDPLHAPPPFAYRLLAAAHASVVTATFKAESGQAVLCALELSHRRIDARVGSPPAGITPALHSPTLQPVADGGNRAIHPTRNFR